MDTKSDSSIILVDTKDIGEEGGRGGGRGEGRGGGMLITLKLKKKKLLEMY